jgi:hypothetical protein
VLQHAGLVHDEVRELRQAVLDVLNATGAHDPRAVLPRRTPEGCLVHPVALADELLAHAERLEHFNRAAGDAVRLTEFERAAATLDEPRADAGKSRELRRQERSSRAAADDEDVDGVGKVRRSVLSAGRRREDVGVAGRVAIEIELHVSSLPSP